MKQIYNQHKGLTESAYKLAVRVYKEVRKLFDYQMFNCL